MQNSSPFLDANLGVLLDGEFYSVAGGKKKEWAIKVFALIADINFAVVGSATEQSQHRWWIYFLFCAESFRSLAVITLWLPFLGQMWEFFVGQAFS